MFPGEGRVTAHFDPVMERHRGVGERHSGGLYYRGVGLIEDQYNCVKAFGFPVFNCLSRDLIWSYQDPIGRVRTEARQHKKQEQRSHRR